MDDMRDRFRGSGAPRPMVRLAPTPQRQQVQSASSKPIAKPNVSLPRPLKKRRAKKVFTTLLLLILVGGSAGAGYWYWANKKATPKSAVANPYAIGNGTSRDADGTKVAAPQGTIRFIATGDMIGHDSINQNAKEGDTYNYLKLMDKMKPYFDKADIRFCNQATPAGGAQFGISGFPVFNAPIEFARGMEALGCNLINTGTNYTNDKGQPLIDATVAAWDDRKVLAVAGANRSIEEQKKVRYFEVKGVKFALLSYGTSSNNKNLTPYGINIYSDALVTEQINEARTKADFVIVSMSWGTEYAADINPEQDQISQKLAGLGADVILGHGPHTVQPFKRLPAKDGRETLVWYSLGNFLNSQLDVNSLVNGMAVMDIDSATKKVTKASFMPVYQHYEWTAEQKNRTGGADLAARHDFTIVPLDTATELLTKSQNNTTVPVQTERIRAVLNKYTPVPIISSTEF